MTSMNRAFTSSVYIVVLRKDLPSPIAAESDEEKATPEAGPEAETGRKPAKDPPAVKIDFDRIGQRILAMPLPPRNYQRLIPGKEGAVFAIEGQMVEPLAGVNTLAVEFEDA